MIQSHIRNGAEDVERVIGLARAFGGSSLFLILRALTHETWELKLSDAAIALLPILVWLVFTGQLKELKFGSEGFTAAFQDAAHNQASIRQTVEKLPVEGLAADEKEGLSDIPRLVNNRDRALIFVLGKQYDPGIAKEYLRQLTRFTFFEFVLIQQNGGAFFGLVDARERITRICGSFGESEDVVARIRRPECPAAGRRGILQL